MPNLYSEIREDLRWIADVLEDNDFEYAAYNRGVQFNAKDRNGIIHSFYPTTGTCLYHWSNDKADRNLTKTIRKQTLNDFMKMLDRPQAIKALFVDVCDELEEVPF